MVVIGAGPGGLAVAAALGERGLEALVIDAAPRVGSSWRGHYDRLHLHTPRRWSGLPGLPIPFLGILGSEMEEMGWNWRLNRYQLDRERD